MKIVRLATVGALLAAATGCMESVTVVDSRFYRQPQGYHAAVPQGAAQVLSPSADRTRAEGQVDEEHGFVPRPRVKRSRIRSWNGESAGPRVGVVHVTGDAVEALRTEFQVEPTLSAWGWQFEYQYLTEEGGPTGLVEFVPLVCGLEQGVALPSLNVLCGIRTASGNEFVIGPNLSPSGVGLTAAVGHTRKCGSMGMPYNFAVVSNSQSIRYSFTFGWNL